MKKNSNVYIIVRRSSNDMRENAVESAGERTQICRLSRALKMKYFRHMKEEFNYYDGTEIYYTRSDLLFFDPVFNGCVAIVIIIWLTRIIRVFYSDLWAYQIF